MKQVAMVDLMIGDFGSLFVGRTEGSSTRHPAASGAPVSYTHLRAHETPEHLVCRLLLEKKNTTTINK